MSNKKCAISSFIKGIDFSLIKLRKHIFIINYYPSNVKEKLNSIILSMAEHHWLFPKSWPRFYTPASWETIFYDTMRLIISMGKGSTNDEIMDYFDLDPDLIPSQSAFCQRRRQISLSALNTFFGILFFFSIHYGQIQRPLYSRLRWVPRCLCYQF